VAAQALYRFRDLQNRYGKESVQPYSWKATKLSGRVQFLQLVFGAPEGADVHATITLPAEYWDCRDNSASAG
jgi:hypothetical protein